MIAKVSEARVICDLKDGDKNMQIDMITKVHWCLKQCLHDLCLHKKVILLSPKHSAGVRLN